MIKTTERKPEANNARMLFTVAVVAFLGLAGVLLASSPPSQAAGEQASGAETTDAEEADVQTDPADGAKLTRPARSLRVWFDRAPIVAESQLSLKGPAGSMQVQGLHTMGEDDLMARVVGSMPNGSYEASYTAKFADGESLTGTWSFEIQRTGQAGH